MPNMPDPSADATADSDAPLRHAPAPNSPGSVQTDDAPPKQDAPIGASWTDPDASSVLRGEAKAGGGDADHPHLFHLAQAAANVFEGGALQGAHEVNWPILKGQNGAVYLARLEPGGVREPHWHPSAWEINFVLQGRARWTFVGPNSTQDGFEAEKGDLVFAPQGHMHCFENASSAEDLIVLIAFNSSTPEPDDDIGIVQSLKAMPADVLAAVFGGAKETFERLPGKLGRVVIARKPS